jgi:Xaa-Pro aminopeptidase
VEAEFAHEFKRHGSRGFAYEPIVASGVNACALHYLQNDQPCRDGELLLMDVAAEYGNYNADLTRTIPIGGKFTDRQRDVYNAVLRVFRLCIDELIVPGKNIRKEFSPEVARAMEEELIQLGLLDCDTVAEERAQGEELKEEKRAYRKYFMHGTAHSLGLDVHDVTPANPCFVEDMVVTVEPGIYLPEEGFGIRLENDIIVKKTGNIDLMKDIPIEADEIEALMAG